MWVIFANHTLLNLTFSCDVWQKFTKPNLQCGFCTPPTLLHTPTHDWSQSQPHERTQTVGSDLIDQNKLNELADISRIMIWPGITVSLRLSVTFYFNRMERLWVWISENVDTIMYALNVLLTVGWWKYNAFYISGCLLRQLLQMFVLWLVKVVFIVILTYCRAVEGN